MIKGDIELFDNNGIIYEKDLMKPFRTINSFVSKSSVDLVSCTEFDDSKVNNILAENLWVPAKPRQNSSIGFLYSSPSFFDMGNSGFGLKLTIRVERKIPPRSLVQDLFKKQMKAKNKSGEVVSREEQKAIRIKIRDSLLPKTLPDYKNISVCILHGDFNENPDEVWVILDQSNGLVSNDILKFLLNSKIVTSYPLPLIKTDHVFSSIKNQCVGKFYATGYARVFNEGRGVREVGFCPGEDINLADKEFIYAMNFSDTDLSFSLRYDGMINQVSHHKDHSNSLCFFMGEWVKIAKVFMY